MDERIPCTQHPQMMEWINALISKVGKYEAHMETALENQHEIFDRLNEIKHIIDQREVISGTIDKQIIQITEIAKSNSENIQKLKSVVENGLTDRTKEIATTVRYLEDEYEKRKQERKIEKARCEAGVGGFFKKSWEDFKNKFGWVLIFVIFYLLCWGFVKAVVFREYPFSTMPKAQVTDIIDKDNNGVDDRLEDHVKEK